MHKTLYTRQNTQLGGGAVRIQEPSLRVAPNKNTHWSAQNLQLIRENGVMLKSIIRTSHCKLGRAQAITVANSKSSATNIPTTIRPTERRQPNWTASRRESVVTPTRAVPTTRVGRDARAGDGARLNYQPERGAGMCSRCACRCMGAGSEILCVRVVARQPFPLGRIFFSPKVVTLCAQLRRYKKRAAPFRSFRGDEHLPRT